MKKIDIINLIKAHTSEDDDLFKSISYRFADEFNHNGDTELAKTIYALLSDAYSFLPQSEEKGRKIGFLHYSDTNKINLYLPDSLMQDLIGIFNAINRKIGINKFLFYGSPGTGKTEAAKILSKKLKRNLWVVSIPDLIDSKLGATSKNISTMFRDINEYPYKNKMIVLFDEIDSLALNRKDSRDLREMARATTELFKGLDSLDPSVILIGTTNLFEDFDKALLRRFNKSINFTRYKQEDLEKIATIFYNDLLGKITNIKPDIKLFAKIVKSYKPLPYPGELKNIIYTSIAFSDPRNPYDYLSRLIVSLSNDENSINEQQLKKKNFTTRDIAKILNKSKSTIGRMLNYAKKKS